MATRKEGHTHLTLIFAFNWTALWQNLSSECLCDSFMVSVLPKLKKVLSFSWDHPVPPCTGYVFGQCRVVLEQKNIIIPDQNDGEEAIPCFRAWADQDEGAGIEHLPSRCQDDRPSVRRDEEEADDKEGLFHCLPLFSIVFTSFFCSLHFSSMLEKFSHNV